MANPSRRQVLRNVGAAGSALSIGAVGTVSAKRQSRNGSGRPDFKVLNNRAESTQVSLVLKGDGQQVDILSSGLKGRDSTNWEDRTAQVDVTVSSSSEYVLFVYTSEEQTAEYRLTVPEEGFHDSESVLVDLRDSETMITESIV